MQLREDDVAAALLRRCGGVKTVWARGGFAAALGRRGGGVKVAWGLRGGGVRAPAVSARVATVWGRCRGGVEAVLGQCEDGMGVMQGLRLK